MQDKRPWGAWVVAFGLLTALAQPATAAAGFQDLNDSYARDEILALAQQGILNGKSPRAFAPVDATTREEFAVIMSRSMHLDIDTDAHSTFSDVSPWAQPYVAAMVKVGIMHGTDGINFEGSRPISREELAITCLNALALGPQAYLYGEQPTFSDASQVSGWARPYVGFAQKIGLFVGAPTGTGQFVFEPQANADRQAVALLAYKFNKEMDVYKLTGHTLISAELRVHTSDPINALYETQYRIDGTGGGGTVHVSLSDGVHTVTGSAAFERDDTFKLTVDTTPLQEGPVTITATQIDVAGATRTATLQTYKDIASRNFAITNTQMIDDTNLSNYPIIGTAEPGAQVTVYAADTEGHDVYGTGHADESGHFAIAVDATKLVDGPIALYGSALDLAWNLVNTEPDHNVQVIKTSSPTLP
ncbi:S-layer homology domain-containing protein [Tumebacillus permanentifrigoris]|uniref:S-layer family protein n=1 Tax=Tumebacillus permanentifrigoris TaxID=378543 RepID=A0A316DE26_9BACL|nr:S-layer homology domain-containing protein [Tumebacillus permanentifrigoris]PWK15956.1 S-layer family protein [Tumebacillus permanentifrigoris]